MDATQEVNKTKSKTADIYGSTHHILNILFSGRPGPDMAERNHVKAMFRHSSSEQIGQNPELFGWIIDHIKDTLYGKEGEISEAEWAIYTALSLCQVGPANTQSHIDLGLAAKIADVPRTRLTMIETADEKEAMRQALRGLVTLLKSKQGVKLNYGDLAVDLYIWQIDHIQAARKWERSYAQKRSLKS